MGKKSLLRSPAVSVPSRLRSNQEDDNDSNVGTTTRRPMQHSASYSDQAATTAAVNLSRPKSVVVLRRCEDLNVRTGGFQKIEEAAHRLDIRRQRQHHQQPQQQSAGDLSCSSVRLVSGRDKQLE